MKRFKFTLLAFMAAIMALSFSACSDDDTTPTKEPEINESDYHFDLFLTVGKHGGMSSKNTTIVKSIGSLTADQGVITVVQQGSELGEYSMEAISKGKYYYQIPSTNDRFVKYQIKNNAVNVIAERPFKTNTYKVRSYTHAWIDDNTLVILSTNGAKDKIIYTKLKADDLSILSEGELDIPERPANWTKLTSSGILTYRKSDNKLFYFYYWKEKAGQTVASEQEPNFHVAVVNPSTMKVESDTTSPVEGEMAGSAYGELMQDCVTYDEAGNLYLASFQEADGIEKGMLLRIKAGETNFDASYNGYSSNVDGKLMTVQYLGGNKALIYARNDAAGTKIDSYSHYYAILDLATGIKTRLSYDGKEIAYSGGRFSQRTVIFNNKAYIGVNTEEDKNAIIYIYDIKTGSVEKGAEVDGRFYYDMIRVIEN